MIFSDMLIPREVRVLNSMASFEQYSGGRIVLISFSAPHRCLYELLSTRDYYVGNGMEQEQQQLPDDSGAVTVMTVDSFGQKARALSAITRELSNDDLNHPGVHKLLIANLDAAEDRCEDLERFRDQYYNADRELAVAKSEMKRLRDNDLIRSGMLGVGSLMLGYVPNSGSNWGLGVILAVGGLILIGVSLYAKPREQ